MKDLEDLAVSSGSRSRTGSLLIVELAKKGPRRAAHWSLAPHRLLMDKFLHDSIYPTT